jgi:hypothetical protein
VTGARARAEACYNARAFAPGGQMANSKSKHNRMKSVRRQKWKARKKRQKAATKSTKK